MSRIKIAPKTRKRKPKPDPEIERLKKQSRAHYLGCPFGEALWWSVADHSARIRRLFVKLFEQRQRACTCHRVAS